MLPIMEQLSMCCTQFSLYWCYMNMIITYDDYYYFLIIKKLDFV